MIGLIKGSKYINTDYLISRINLFKVGNFFQHDKNILPILAKLVKYCRAVNTSSLIYLLCPIPAPGLPLAAPGPPDEDVVISSNSPSLKNFRLSLTLPGFSL